MFEQNGFGSLDVLNCKEGFIANRKQNNAKGDMRRMSYMVEKDSDAVNEKDKYSSDLTFYRFIIDSIPSAVLTVNADLKITGFNPWAEKITGYSKKEALGKYCGEILQGGMCLAHCPLRTVLKGHRPVSLVET
ncbi:MAG: PAS domain-containing protein, partial [Desulfobacterales bacterium]|nr:PAS domain-containing protein [Desulfobacterales bacterium]